MVDLSVLSDHAAEAQGWSPLTLDRLTMTGSNMAVLCYDQTLASTGLVILERLWGQVTVIQATTLTAASEHTSFEEDFDRALQIEDQVRESMACYLDPGPDATPIEVRVAHETPPVLSAQMMRKMPGAGTSSRMAAQAVRSAAHHYGASHLVRMVNAQQAKTLVCGDHRADKRKAHAALKETVFPIVRESHLVTNEHQRDAMMLGLVVLARGL